jgi:hypothetical protein
VCWVIIIEGGCFGDGEAKQNQSLLQGVAVASDHRMKRTPLIFHLTHTHST